MINTNKGRQTVLWADDDPDDLEIFCDVARQINQELRIIQVNDGTQAMNFLQAALQTNELPCLIVLDLNMPPLDGRKTLQEIKKDSRLQNVPVVVFTTSKNPIDRIYCEKFGTDKLTKPSSFDSIRDTIEKVLQHSTSN